MAILVMATLAMARLTMARLALADLLWLDLLWLDLLWLYLLPTRCASCSSPVAPSRCRSRAIALNFKPNRNPNANSNPLTPTLTYPDRRRSRRLASASSGSSVGQTTRARSISGATLWASEYSVHVHGVLYGNGYVSTTTLLTYSRTKYDSNCVRIYIYFSIVFFWFYDGFQRSGVFDTRYGTLYTVCTALRFTFRL